MIKKSLLISVVSIVVIAIGCMVYLNKISSTKVINLNKEAVSIVLNDPSSAKPTVIFIKGKIYRPLFKDHYFEGSIVIDGYDFTQNPLNRMYLVEKKKGINKGMLGYHMKQKPYDTTNLGLIYYDNDFKNINITWKTTPEEFSSNLYIVTANSYDQAIEVQNQMREKIKDENWFEPHK
ncbi:hypothetical protein [Paenibacillus sp. MMO-177]|uniref:hypothetical protein n=1 Tax=Paenibacillus sp. MMO-177 TaxID=3081289 RepID=UPI00301B0A8E